MASRFGIDNRAYILRLIREGVVKNLEQPRSAALRLVKIEADINGILSARRGPLQFISFLP
jgi:hypothetical protein